MRFEKIQKILSQKTVGIAGCGGLGSNAAVALARVGVGTLVLADCDTVEESNLNRQYYFKDQIGIAKATALKENVERVNPRVKVVVNVIVLNPAMIMQLFSGCDLVLEALDTAEMKEMFIESVQNQLPQIPVIAGVGVGGWGKNEWIHAAHSGNLHIIGDERTEVNEENPALAPRVGIVSNMMANLALELLLGCD